MTNIVPEVWRKSPKSPPSFATVRLRRETYRELLKAGEFFAARLNADCSPSEILDELLVLFAIARKEALGGAAHA